MQVWNVLHAARCKYRTQNWRKKSPPGHHRTTLSDWIFATKARIDNRKKKRVKQQYLVHMSSQYGERRPTIGWDRSGSLGHLCKFQRVWRLGSVTARHCSSGRQPNFPALNRGRHLYSVGWPSRWAFAHISRSYSFNILNFKGCRCGHSTLTMTWPKHIIFRAGVVNGVGGGFDTDVTYLCFVHALLHNTPNFIIYRSISTKHIQYIWCNFCNIPL